MDQDEPPKKKGLSLFLLIPMGIGAVLLPRLFEDRLSVAFGFDAASILGAAIDGAIGGGLGALLGYGVGWLLMKAFKK